MKPRILVDWEIPVHNEKSVLGLYLQGFGWHRLEFRVVFEESRKLKCVAEKKAGSKAEYRDADSGETVDFLNPFPSIDM